MPFPECSVMSSREEFVRLASCAGANVRELCRRFTISPTTGYKWLERYSGGAGLRDRSRRPHRSPGRTPERVEAAVLAVRDRHPHWGGRKIAAVLRRRAITPIPSPSTITEILRRNDCLRPEEQAHLPYRSFERARPNELWQMDFKGHFAHDRGRCHPLTVLDDHSRYALCLRACADEQSSTVEGVLVPVFKRYGLPEAILTDNAQPWADPKGYVHTRLSVWLMRLGIAVIHGRPYHPQTQGKEERFHRTLKIELLQGRAFRDLAHCQHAFDAWRPIYNMERPHQALGLHVPAERYQPSARPYTETLPPLEYGAHDIVRKVQQDGRTNFSGRIVQLSRAFTGYHVAFRPTVDDGVFTICFGAHRIARIDLNDEPVT